jgi:hypothetical protein
MNKRWKGGKIILLEFSLSSASCKNKYYLILTMAEHTIYRRNTINQLLLSETYMENKRQQSHSGNS